eukprot:11203961-Lingulodinium_polyedra.AAC.1
MTIPAFCGSDSLPGARGRRIQRAGPQWWFQNWWVDLNPYQCPLQAARSHWRNIEWEPPAGR